MTKTLHIVALLLTMTICATAQMVSPAHFKVSQEVTKDGFLDVTFSCTIDKGWHVYSTDLGDAGPISAEVTTENAVGAEDIPGLKAVGNEIKKYDQMFMAEVRYFEKEAKFVKRYRLKGGKYDVRGSLEYGACNDESCTPPTRVEFHFTGDYTKPKPKEVADTPGKADKPKENTTKEQPQPELSKSESVAPWRDSLLWQPSAAVTASADREAEETTSWATIFLMGLLGGLIALFTPCVWPIIPMTVSFFMKRAENDKSRTVRDAVLYGVAIVAIYLTLGLVVSLVWGASALNALATNAVFNIFLAALLVVFALSFFGWFELSLPSTWGNALDSRASRASGLLGLLLMAGTLAVVSFSCTGPIIGFLLVGVGSTGELAAPAIGMLGFALALALPFSLFALFPTLLKRAPRSGSWMNTIKVTLGFIELAFALKFFSVADLAYGWRLLDREVFLALWFVIFLSLGLYLMGILHFRSDSPEGGNAETKPVACIVLGMISLAFAVYLLPGLWGAPCKAVSAFAPPMHTQDFNLYRNDVSARYTDYETGLAAARAEGKPALLDFTGFGCVNCRKMEAAVWNDPEVASLLNERYVLISLYVDDKTPLASPFSPQDEQGKPALRTEGDKWSYLQRHKFRANAQPFYVAIAADGTPLAAPQGFTEDAAVFAEFLRKAAAAGQQTKQK